MSLPAKRGEPRPRTSGLRQARGDARGLRREAGRVRRNAAEIIKAVEQLKSLEWEDIRKERFNMTPLALYTDLVNIAECLLHRQAAEMRLRLLFFVVELCGVDVGLYAHNARLRMHMCLRSVF